MDRPALADRLVDDHPLRDGGLPDGLAADDPCQFVVATFGLAADGRNLVDDHAGQLQIGVVRVPDLVDRVGDRADAAQTEGGRLDHHQCQVGGDQPAHREIPERRRAIDQNGVVVGGHLPQCPAQPFRLAGLVILQVARGRDQVDLQPPVRHHDVDGCLRTAQHVGGRGLIGGRVVSEHPRARALGVQVDDQHPITRLGCCGGQTEGDGGLADATLLVQQRGYSTHRGHRATPRGRSDTRYLGRCRMLARRTGSMASNVSSLGSGALP